MNNEIEWLTVLAVEKQTNIPNATIRRYFRNHGHHLNLQKKGKSYLMASESIPIVLTIRRFYDDGKSSDQVEKALADIGNPVTITIDADGEQMTLNVGEALQDMKKDMHEQSKVIQSLIEHMQRQQEYIDVRLEERDKKLMIAIRESQESKIQLVAEQEKETTSSAEYKRWYQFWKS